MTTITIQRPATIRIPRGAPIAAALAFKFLDACEHMLTERRARKIEATRVAEAAEVRRYAESVRAVDPRFASDLLAAADRHELAA